MPARPKPFELCVMGCVMRADEMELGKTVYTVSGRGAEAGFAGA
jgi:hypothetical protein